MDLLAIMSGVTPLFGTPEKLADNSITAVKPF
jgi:hypothetical protein